MSSQIAKSAASLGIGAYQPPRMTRTPPLSALARAARGRLRTRRSGAAALARRCSVAATAMSCSTASSRHSSQNRSPSAPNTLSVDRLTKMRLAGHAQVTASLAGGGAPIGSTCWASFPNLCGSRFRRPAREDVQAFHRMQKHHESDSRIGQLQHNKVRPREVGPVTSARLRATPPDRQNWGASSRAC